MFDYETTSLKNDLGAGGLQDIYSLIIFGKEYEGTFVDIGCRHPILHNNTFLLGEYGWRGLAVDWADHKSTWEKYRLDCKYINADAFSVDYLEEFNNLNFNSPIDFLSIDLESAGDRFKILKQIFETGYEFKTITIEHDAYCQPVEKEKNPQREFLSENGYVLVKKCEWIEDFWINPKYINRDQYEILIQFNSLSEEISPAKFLRKKEYDWTHFYDKIDMERISEFI